MNCLWECGNTKRVKKVSKKKKKMRPIKIEFWPIWQNFRLYCSFCTARLRSTGSKTTASMYQLLFNQFFEQKRTHGQLFLFSLAVPSNKITNGHIVNPHVHYSPINWFQIKWSDSKRKNIYIQTDHLPNYFNSNKQAVFN